MRNDGQKSQGAVPLPGRANGFLPTSFRTLSSYLKIVSSGASTVASTVRSAASAASAIVDRENDANTDQVQWAGFDKLECDGDVTRQVLLLGYRFGFQVWDVEESDNVHNLVSKHDGPVSFLQMSPSPIASKRNEDKFADSRPLLVICAEVSVPGNAKDGIANYAGNIQNCHDPVNVVPTVVQFYSLRTQSYVNVLKFRSVVYSIRCSSRVVAILQASQIHCFDAATLEREYTILTNPIVYSGSVSIGYGPLAVGPRWLAYSGSPIAVTNSGRVSPQHLTHASSFSASTLNGNMVAHYAKESSKQLAAGIVTLGDMGYKKLSRYYSELLPDGYSSLQSGNPGSKGNGTIGVHMPDVDNIGMVIVRDIINKSVIAQFRAHKSPISSLCFDPSGMLLVTASVQGHNVNVFRLIPGQSGSSSNSDSDAPYVHLYRLQRGFTNAVIQDICFSDDSHWIMVSSSRGTNHLFAISPLGGSVSCHCDDDGIAVRSGGPCYITQSAAPLTNLGLQRQTLCASGPPITLSVVGRIRSGNNSWRNAVSGAAAAATGRMSSFPGAIATAFHDSKSKNFCTNPSSLKAKYHLLVFSPSGCVIQYALRISSGLDSVGVISGMDSCVDSVPESDVRLVFQPIQKWNIGQKQNRREREDNTDIYGDNVNSDSSKIFPEGIETVSSAYAKSRGVVSKSKIADEDRHHVYISEAELQTHQGWISMWAKPQMYFHCMTMDGIKMDGESAALGGIDIERIPSRTIEPRSKNLVPAFDYLHTVIPASDGLNYGIQQHPRSGSHYSMTLAGGGSVAIVANCHSPSDKSKDSVNTTNVSPNTPLEIVNNRENSAMEAAQPIISVNNNIEGRNIENHFEAEGDEFD